MFKAGSPVYAILHNALVECYNFGGIKLLCLRMGINPAAIVIAGKSIDEVALELILYCQQRGIEDALIKAVIDERPGHPAVTDLANSVSYADRNTLDFLPTVSDEDRKNLLKVPMPSGVVTICFSDIEGSTPFSQTMGEDKAHELIEQHNKIIRQCIKEYQGYEVKSLGDGFMMAFSTLTAGILCALDIQCRFAIWNAANPHRQVWIRMGINTGEVIPQGIDYGGDTVNATARIIALAKGGQIVVSETVKNLCGDKLAIRFSDHGRHNLKGLRGDYQLYLIDCWHHRY